MQPGEPAGIAPACLDPLPGPARDQRRRHHIAGHPHRGQQPVQLKAARARLVTRPQHGPVSEPADQVPHRAFLVPHPIDHRDFPARHEDRYHDRVLGGVHSQVDRPRR